MVNRENCMKVAEAFATQSLAKKGILGYNQGHYTPERYEDDNSGHGCGTTACIAGWTVAALRGNRAYLDMVAGQRVSVEVEDALFVRNEAKELLGLSESQASALFDDGDPHPVVSSPEHATCAVATILSNLAKTGRLMSWGAAAEKVGFKDDSNAE